MFLDDVEGTLVSKHVFVKLVWFCTFQPPKVNNCTMLAIDYYDVRINSIEGEIVSERIYNKTTLLFEYSNNHSNSSITFRVNVTVVDIKGQRSNLTTFMKIIGMYVCTLYHILPVNSHGSDSHCLQIVTA